MTRYITPDDSFYGYGPDGRFYSRHTGPPPQPTPIEDEVQDPEAWRLYRLCPCWVCSGTGKTEGRCKTCRGEGRNLELVATCGSKEAVGVALVTLADEGEWDECPFGLMHRPSGEKGVWKILPWLPSARNLSDAGRQLANARHSS